MHRDMVCSGVTSTSPCVRSEHQSLPPSPFTLPTTRGVTGMHATHLSHHYHYNHYHHNHVHYHHKLHQPSMILLLIPPQSPYHSTHSPPSPTPNLNAHIVCRKMKQNVKIAVLSLFLLANAVLASIHAELDLVWVPNAVQEGNVLLYFSTSTYLLSQSLFFSPFHINFHLYLLIKLQESYAMMAHRMDTTSRKVSLISGSFISKGT